MDNRAAQLTAWLGGQLGSNGLALVPVAGDASFRRYFRVCAGGTCYIAMDAPPEHEDCGPFVAIAHHWRNAGIHVPAIIKAFPDEGFLLLEDLGDELYLDVLTPANADRLYGDALKTLVQIQQVRSPLTYPLPSYDSKLLMREMELFREWLVIAELGLDLSTAENALLDTTFSTLREAALAQPQVTVHRDYHSRNLLVTDENSPGVIDFQDAVTGPITYDLVSLLRDAYVAWPENDLGRWVEQFRLASADAGLHRADPDTFRQWFELMGMQRHLKVAGIFARLYRRDGKSRYLADIPRTVDYLLGASAAQPAMRSFTAWLEERVIPRMGAMAPNPKTES